jgi:predicted secreted hydrolase
LLNDNNPIQLLTFHTTCLTFGVTAVIRTCFLRALSIQFVQHLATTAALLTTLFCQHSIADDVATKEQSHFQVAQPGRGLSFPTDHGSHPAFETEWWYLTGHLVPKGGSVFGSPTSYGVQLTFFRRRKGDGSWGQLYAAHGALGNVVAGTFTHDMRYARSGMGLVDVSERNLQISLLDWGLESISDRWLLRWGVGESTKIRLITNPITPKMIVPQGDGGYSKKAPCESCASMYYSVPQIQAEGEIRIGDKVVPVSGLLWMDHEFMTNSLDESQVGWDWMGLMLRDGRSLMLFRLRDKEGRPNFASGTVRSGEESKVFTERDFTLTPLSTWKSEKTGAEYPIEWRIVVPSAGIDTVIKARVNKSELGEYSAQEKKSDAVRYWEGPVASSDESVTGYLEMTGYAGKVAL